MPSSYQLYSRDLYHTSRKQVPNACDSLFRSTEAGEVWSKQKLREDMGLKGDLS